MEMDNGLSSASREKLRGGLVKLLADNYAVYLKTQKYHWNVKGREFHALHKMFEEQYQHFEEVIDDIAERIRALGFNVQATFTFFKECTSIPEESENISTDEMLKNLVTSNEVIIRNARHICSLADKEADHGTVDMLGKQIRENEKIVWMLRSSL